MRRNFHTRAFWKISTGSKHLSGDIDRCIGREMRCFREEKTEGHAERDRERERSRDRHMQRWTGTLTIIETDRNTERQVEERFVR